MTTSICEEAETASEVVAEREQLDKVTCQADRLFTQQRLLKLRKQRQRRWY